MMYGRSLWLVTPATLVVLLSCLEPPTRAGRPSATPTSPKTEESSVTTPPDPEPAGDGDGVNDATLDLVELSPLPGAALNPDSVLRAKLRYSLARQPDAQYVIVEEFRMSDDGGTLGGYLGKQDYPAVHADSGTVEIVLPMHEVLDDSRLASPLEVRFLLGQAFAQTVTPLARTQFFQYPSQ